MLLRRDFLSYLGKIVGGYFVINAASSISVPKKDVLAAEKNNSWSTVSGFVHDAMTHNPIPDAHIRILGRCSVFTESNGHYQKNLRKGIYTFTIRAVNYETKTKTVNVDKLNVNMDFSLVDMDYVNQLYKR